MTGRRGQVDESSAERRQSPERPPLLKRPTATTSKRMKKSANLYAATRRNRLRSADLSDDLELHSTILNDKFQVRKVR
jgi:hypothetical protein